MTSTVKVLHSFIDQAGSWVSAGDVKELDTSFARKLESDGYVDVLSSDGVEEVWQPCCNGEHSH